VAEEFATATVARATLQHFSIYYDSLIEKCSTLSVVCACTGLTVFFSPKLSVGME
jgi:hypothetical protein